MRKARIFLAIMTLCVICSIANAQGTNPCPSISVTGPSGIIPIGGIATYSVSVGEGSRIGDLAFEWATSHGTINRGQGTREIDVVQPNALITATVTVSGLTEGCPNTASETSTVNITPLPTKIIEIDGKLSKVKIGLIEKGLEEYRNDRYSQVYLIVYGSRKKLIRKKIDSLRILFNDDPSRATFVTSGSKLDRVVVWVVPPGVENPIP